ncbi:hypothetical protein K7X08_028138 [Anisodus acutangulus]|uniref:Uncharacterized protein n=1 Tax=Anisodus acutangulus TaxID=402998 RepID=A0A9Q1RR25_9SOLA|nr:hypothetical protein K7X08_028138 [Anisodus acutangulus]
MSSSSSASEEVGDGGNRGGNGEGGYSSRRRQRGGENGVWPEPFLEALASQMAVDAYRSIGRLAAAQALSNLFQDDEESLLRKLYYFVDQNFVFGLQQM